MECKPDGSSVFIMPAQDFYYLSDKDLGDLIAYIRSVSPVDRVASKPQLHFTFLGSVMYGFGVFGNQLIAGEIDQAHRPSVPEPGVNPAYGKYLVNINGCRSCHGAQLAGGKPGAPGSPLAPNLTPGGELTAWSEADFIKTLRTGVTPSGTNLPDQFMPWQFKSQMTDDELKAVFAYLKSLPRAANLHEAGRIRHTFVQVDADRTPASTRTKNFKKRDRFRVYALNLSLFSGISCRVDG